MNHWLCVFFSCSGLLVATATAAPIQTYDVDPARTRVVISVEHAGSPRTIAIISGSEGVLRFDQNDWRNAQLDVTVPLNRLDSGGLTVALGARLLGDKRHPNARFVSRMIEPIDANHADVCGGLTLHGVTRPQCMSVAFNAINQRPTSSLGPIGFSATAAISRTAFGINAWQSVIDDTVTLTINAEVVCRCRREKPGVLTAYDHSANR